MGIPNYYKLKLWVNHVSGYGFSESYPLATPDRGYAKADAALICSNRALLLADGMSIVNSVISNSDTVRDSMLPAAHLIDPLELDTEDGEGVEECNRMNEGYLIRLYTNEGKWITRLIRGLRDSWISGVNATVTPSATTGPGSWTTPDAGFTAADALGQFLSVLLHKTQYVKKLPTDPVSYDNIAWQGVGVERTGSRDCGPGYSPSRGRRKARV